jgi:hypothetical protein
MMVPDDGTGREPREWGLDRRDVARVQRHGLTPEQVLRQLEFLKTPPPFVKVVRPCTSGDGIRVLSEADARSLGELACQEAQKGRLMKFVPASGAATRMFRGIMGSLSGHRQGDPELEKLIRGLCSMPFHRELDRAMARAGWDLATALASERYDVVARYLLTEEGLGYATLPKALLPFHRYDEGGRTALEEHLSEAAGYLRDARGVCRLHFTVSPEHAVRFRSVLRGHVRHYGHRLAAVYEVGVSPQHPATDTVALDVDGKPFRREDGSLLFRAGGHGALLKNLNELDGDVVFIGNIDNVCPDWLKPPRLAWRRTLAGLLIRLQRRVHAYLRRLGDGGHDPEVLEEILAFARDEFGVSTPARWATAPPPVRRGLLREALDKPIRVCGMVPNLGEPGGGPFWVEGPDGGLTLQIVEGAQIDPQSDEQGQILARSTHFNPVDIVCGLRDYRGIPFDLAEHADPDAFFVSCKSYGGRPLKAIELPGLWNGGMAGWLTAFVETPDLTFTPVKTVADLLRKEHQPPSDSRGAGERGG